MLSKNIKHYIRNHPMQAFLFVYNAGVFSYLKTVAFQVSHQLPFQNNEFISNVSGLFNIPVIGQYLTSVNINSFLQSSPYRWLIVSIVMSILYSFVKGVFKIILSVVIIGAGLYLVYLYARTKGYIVI